MGLQKGGYMFLMGVRASFIHQAKNQPFFSNGQEESAFLSLSLMLQLQNPITSLIIVVSRVVEKQALQKILHKNRPSKEAEPLCWKVDFHFLNVDILYGFLVHFIPWKSLFISIVVVIEFFKPTADKRAKNSLPPQSKCLSL